LALFAESLWAMTEPADPPPTMMKSYNGCFPLYFAGRLAQLGRRVTLADDAETRRLSALTR
jgi:hypothetical protein